MLYYQPNITIIHIYFDEPIPTLFIVTEPDRASALMHRCELMNNTGDRFRSYVLGVMSPARCPCATPVK